MVTFAPVVMSPIVPVVENIEPKVYVPAFTKDVLLPVTHAEVKGPPEVVDQRAEFQAPVPESVV
jgi:hypothetical protein